MGAFRVSTILFLLFICGILSSYACPITEARFSARQKQRDENVAPEETPMSELEINTLPSADDPESIPFGGEAAEVIPKLLGDNWKRMPYYPIKVSEAQGAIVTVKGVKHLVVLGGYLFGTNFDVTDRVYSIKIDDDIANGKWIRRANMPHAITHVGQVAVGHKLFMCGGFLGKHPGPSIDNCYVYDMLMDKWRDLPSLPHKRAGGGIVHIKKTNSLFFAGGVNRKAGSLHGIDHDDSYMLDLDKDWSIGWIKKASFHNPRNHMSAIEVDGRYFFIGGQHRGNEETGNQKALTEYVPNEDKWYKRANMPYGIGHLSASTPKWGGGFLVIGGVQNGRAKSDDILFYDIPADSWIEVGKYPRSVQTPVCGLTKDTIYCSTGAGDTGSWDEGWFRKIGHVDSNLIERNK